MSSYDDMRTIRIDIDCPGGWTPPIALCGGDVGGRRLHVELRSAGAPVAGEGLTCRLEFDPGSGPGGYVTMEPAEGDGTAAWEADVPRAALASSSCRLCVAVYEGASCLCTRSFEASVERPLIDADHPEAQDALAEFREAVAALDDIGSDAATAEAARKEAESGRLAAEADRRDAEGARAAAEAGRAQAEAARKDAEAKRVEAEGARGAAEEAREGAEAGRSEAETARTEAEAARELRQAKNDADQAANNAAAQGLQVVKLAESQYDPSTLTPTIGGEVGTLYFVPIPSDAMSALMSVLGQKGEPGDSYLEWMWIDGAWERVGMSNATLVGLTTGEIDRVAAGEQVASEGVLNGTGLSYLWSKIRGLFAAAGHSHATGDVSGLDEALGDKATKAEVKEVRDSLSRIFKTRSVSVETNQDGLAPLGLPFASTTVLSAWHNAAVDGRYAIVEPYFYQMSDNTWGARCTDEAGAPVSSQPIHIGCVYIDT